MMDALPFLRTPAIFPWDQGSTPGSAPSIPSSQPPPPRRWGSREIGASPRLHGGGVLCWVRIWESVALCHSATVSATQCLVCCDAFLWLLSHVHPSLNRHNQGCHPPDGFLQPKTLCEKLLKPTLNKVYKIYQWSRDSKQTDYCVLIHFTYWITVASTVINSGNIQSYNAILSACRLARFQLQYAGWLNGKHNSVMIKFRTLLRKFWSTDKPKSHERHYL